MRGLIPENVLDEILSRIDIVELISGYIPLKRAGRNFKALCPFHHEKTASFMVSADRQIYHCFGCGAGGNAYNFLIQYERLEFKEAVETLARKAGLVLPESPQQDTKASGLITQLYKINELTALFYENNLHSQAGLAARGYLEKRGIKGETIRLFKLGLALDKWDGLITYLRSKSANLSLLEKAGLVVARQGGGYYDRFRDRAIFPIFDIKSRPLGFGGRLLPQDAARQADASAKYINSPETAIYTKGKNLYGLNFSKDAIRENDSVVIVEGYLDFIIPYQEGLRNVVASLGTALTLEQVRLLKRYTHNVVMIYDADEAGQMATLRTLDIFLEEGMNVRIASLPEGFDPDSFVRKNGIEELNHLVSLAEPLFDYKLRMLKSRWDCAQIEAKAKVCSEMLPTLNKFKNAVLRSEYLKRLAESLNIKEEALLQELKKIKEDRPQAGQTESPAAVKPAAMNPTEKLLIKLMLEEKGLIARVKEALEPADFQDESASRVVSIMFDLIEQGKSIEPSNLMSHVADPGLSVLISESVFLPEASAQEKEKILQDCIRRLKTARLLFKKKHLHEEIKKAENSGDEERLHHLSREFNHLIKSK